MNPSVESAGRVERIRPFSALEEPGFTARLGELGTAADRVWLAAPLLSLVLSAIALRWPYPRYEIGNVLVYSGLLAIGGLFLWAASALKGRGADVFARLLGLGMVAGLFELLVDWALVHGVPRGRLVYLTGQEARLLASPAWMPLAWALQIAASGYPILKLYDWLSKRMTKRSAAAAASVLGGLQAGLTIGFYEYCAYFSGCWRYEGARFMLGSHLALVIPVAEAMMFGAFLPIAAPALAEERSPVAACVSAGVRFAAAIGAGYALAYLALEAW